MEIVWEECEPTVENFWENIKNCDRHNSLQQMIMVIPMYYKFEGNENKTPRDLEMEMRERGLNVGLIACDPLKDPSIKKAMENNSLKVIKSRYAYKKGSVNLRNTTEEHNAKYNVIVSCRPREYVIKETLEHSSSMEENLEKLEEGGELVSIENNSGNEYENESENVHNLTDEEKSISQLISEGKKLLRFKEVNLEEIFIEYKKRNPESEMKLYSMSRNGEPIMAMCNDTKIVCPIGMIATMDNEGKHQYKFIPLTR